MRKLVLYYLYTFLALDMLMGFLLVYLGLQDVLLINPGQLVRGTLLILLLAVLITDAMKQLNLLNGCILLAISYFILYVAVVFLKKNLPGMWPIELNNASKYMFMLLLIYYINKHRQYFLAHLDKIMLVSFCLLTLNLFLGYFVGVGISTYGQSTTATKGLIYSGNAVSILSLAFLTYYFFNIRNDPKAKYLSLIAVFNIYIVGTKAIFIVPVVIVFYLFTKIRWTAVKTIAGASILVPLLIVGLLLITPFLTQIFQARYLDMLRETGFKVGNTQGASGDLQDAVLAYRRVAFAVEQGQHQFQDVDGLIFGYGNAGQRQFWTQQGYFYTFAAMDFFDFLFQYGIVGCLLFYSIIFYVFYLVIKRWKFTPLTVSFIFIFLYSFFAGYVLSETTASTMFALLIALNLPRQGMKGREENHQEKQLWAATV